MFYIIIIIFKYLKIFFSQNHIGLCIIPFTCIDIHYSSKVLSDILLNIQ